MPVEAIFAGPRPHDARGGRTYGCDPAAAGRATRGRGLSALYTATRDGYRDHRSGGLAAAWRGWHDRGGEAGARLGRADADPCADGRAKLVGERPSGVLFEEAGRLAAQDARPISDTRGSAGYRATLVAVLVARALAECSRRLGFEVAVAMKALLNCTINGEDRSVLADTRDTLLDLLRDRLGLTGTKEGCGNGTAAPARC